MNIVHLKFLPTFCIIQFPHRYRIRPKVEYGLDVMNTTMTLTYSIDMPEVNIRIKEPNKIHLTSGTEGTFKKEVVLEQTEQGVMKNFNLVLTVSLGGRNTRTIYLPIIYQ